MAKKKSRNKFTAGDQVVIHRPHLHGIQAEVVSGDDDGYVCRIGEHQYEGHLVSFPAKQLEALKKEHADLHPSERLEHDYEDK